MPTASETEKWAEWYYIVRKWVTHRIVSTSKQVKGGFWVSQRNDLFGRFDVIAINPTNGYINLIQVTRGEAKAMKHKTAIKKWWYKNCFFPMALRRMSIFVFLYYGRPRKHFKIWQLVIKGDDVKWQVQAIKSIPKKEEVETICKKKKTNRR